MLNITLSGKKLNKEISIGSESIGASSDGEDESKSTVEQNEDKREDREEDDTLSSMNNSCSNLAESWQNIATDMYSSYSDMSQQQRRQQTHGNHKQEQQAQGLGVDASQSNGDDVVSNLSSNFSSTKGSTKGSNHGSNHGSDHGSTRGSNHGSNHGDNEHNADTVCSSPVPNGILSSSSSSDFGSEKNLNFKFGSLAANGEKQEEEGKEGKEGGFFSFNMLSGKSVNTGGNSKTMKKNLRADPWNKEGLQNLDSITDKNLYSLLFSNKGNSVAADRFNDFTNESLQFHDDYGQYEYDGDEDDSDGAVNHGYFNYVLGSGSGTLKDQKIKTHVKDSNSTMNIEQSGRTQGNQQESSLSCTLNEDMNSTISSLSSSTYIMPVIPFDLKNGLNNSNMDDFNSSGRLDRNMNTSASLNSDDKSATEESKNTYGSCSSSVFNYSNKEFVISVYGPLKDIFYSKASEGYKKLLVVQDDITKIEIPIIIYSRIDSNVTLDIDEFKLNSEKLNISQQQGTEVKFDKKVGNSTKKYKIPYFRWGSRFSSKNTNSEKINNTKTENHFMDGTNEGDIDEKNINYLLEKFNELLLVPIVDSSKDSNQSKDYLQFLEPFLLNDNLKILHHPVDITNNHDVFKLCRSLYKLKSEFQNKLKQRIKLEADIINQQNKQNQKKNDIPGDENNENTKIVADLFTRQQFYKIKRIIYGYHNIGSGEKKNTKPTRGSFTEKKDDEAGNGIDKTSLWMISLGLGLGFSITLYYFNINPLKSLLKFFNSQTASSTSSSGLPPGVCNLPSISVLSKTTTLLVSPKTPITNIYCYYLNTIPHSWSLNLLKFTEWTKSTNLSVFSNHNITDFPLEVYSYSKSAGLMVYEYVQYSVQVFTKQCCQFSDWIYNYIFSSNNTLSGLNLVPSGVTPAVPLNGLSTSNLEVSKFYQNVGSQEWVPKLYEQTKYLTIEIKNSYFIKSFVAFWKAMVSNTLDVYQDLKSFYQHNFHNQRIFKSLSGASENIVNKAHDTFLDLHKFLYESNQNYSHIMKTIDA